MSSPSSCIGRRPLLCGTARLFASPSLPPPLHPGCSVHRPLPSTPAGLSRLLHRPLLVCPGCRRDPQGISESTEPSFNMSSEDKHYRLEEKNVFKLQFRCSPKGVHRLIKKLTDIQKTWIVEMGLGIFLSLPSVELPHYLVQPLLHLVHCEHETVKIGDQHVGIKPLIPVILGLPSEPGMDKLPSVDGDLLDTESLEEIIGAGLVQGKFEDRLKEINDPAVFKLAFLSFILNHLLCPNSKAQIKESISSLKSKIESIREAGWCNYIYAQLMIAIRKYKRTYSLGTKNGTFVGGCMYILAVIHLDFLDTIKKPHPGNPRIPHITNDHFQQMKKLHFKYLLLKDTVYANCDEMLSEVALAGTNTGCLEVSSSGITSTHDAAECFNERKRKMLHVKEAMGARSKRLVKTATYKQEQVHPVVITSGAKESDNVRSASAEAAAAPTEIGASSASVVYEG